MERREPGDASDAFDVDGAGTDFGAGGGAALLYDEDGGLVLARARDDGRHAAADAPAMPARLLNGSWYLHFVPEGPHTAQAIRGPMRIEVAPPRVRISGDVYVARAGTGATEVLHPFVESAALFGRKWYPQLPMKQYAWHFRSVGVEYIGGVLTFKFERRVWSQMTQEFVATDTGWMKFECRGEITNHAEPAGARADHKGEGPGRRGQLPGGCDQDLDALPRVQGRGRRHDQPRVAVDGVHLRRRRDDVQRPSTPRPAGTAPPRSATRTSRRTRS